MQHAGKLAAALALTFMCGAAIAQSGGGNGQGGTGGGNAHGAATAGPTAGGDPASGAMAKPKKSHKSMTHKPANDTTNMPGANASSDTKGS
jgi:hypothetical protein